jgi:NTE family protein
MNAKGTDPSAKAVNFALQGGGAHGAFTWGVLDRVLEDERIAIEGISATSAGAMNAAVLAYGLAAGGRDAAREALADFWRRIADAASLSPLRPPLFGRTGQGLEYSPVHIAFDMLSRVLSPYQWNPLNLDPLRGVLEQVVDFEALRQSSAVKLFLSATNVRTGKIKVFANEEVTADCVLASACLPLLHQAVCIGGEHYWDGGYMGNPALFPLIYGCESRDIVVVHVNPIERPDIPHSAQDIMNRINEISFNSSLMREMRAVAFVTGLLDEGKLANAGLKRMLVHAISAEDVMQGLGAASKLNADWDFLTHLYEIGRERAGAWIEAHYAALNVESTIDIHTAYL